MINSIAKLADTISELRQMLRMERAKAESMKTENFSLKKKNQELEILMDNILGSQAKQCKIPLTATQKTFEIRSNLINEAEHNKHRKRDKENKPYNNTGIPANRQTKIKGPKGNELNSKKDAMHSSQLKRNKHRRIHQRN